MKFDQSCHKSVILVDDALSLGLAANAVSVVGSSLGYMLDNLIGPDIHSQDNVLYQGVIYSPLPILLAKGPFITELHANLRYDSEIVIMPFSSLAQSCRTYDEYKQKMSLTPSNEIKLVALGMVGEKKRINKYTGNLALFR